MIYDEQFIESLPSDKVIASKKVIEKFIEFDQKIYTNKRLDSYSDFIEAFAALEAFIQSRDIEDKVPSLGDDKSRNILIIRDFFYALNSKYDKILAANELETARIKYKGLFQNGFVYKFTDGDLKRIQTLINELRDSISESENFDAKHKERLLRKLEGLQKELHKTVSSLDKFWGLIGDAGVAIGKFGNDAKPFVDRIKEITEIIWRTQANAEELPSGTKIPLLKSSDKE